MFQIGDKVKYINGKCTYEVISVETTHMLLRGSGGVYATSPDKIELVSYINTPEVPDNSNNNPINSMQYFHTAVLVTDTSPTSTCANYNYKELVPYAVRTAKDSSDMRDTLVRELEKGIVTSDCKFLISPIF